MAPRVLAFTVTGIPQPKGSTRSFVPFAWAQQAVAAGKSPRAVTTSDNPEAKGWQQLVREQAQTVAGGTLLVGPVKVAIVFRLPRPVSLPRRVVAHLRKPDLDKLVRLVLDGMRGVIYADDRAVVDLRARKVYAPVPSPPGAEIVVGEAAALTFTTSGDLFAEEV
jgi:Holliday junction resolvase RusA-like endonuclease